ncbi:MAG TPA: TRCF domain-containing protein, partial [Kineosporiaceae bacterium]|nr:TRCF domain-containing protein [Kineosporiaceae bacterium]
LPVDAHLPHDYVPGERLRLEAYRKIAEVTAEEGIQAIREELEDRYGAVPDPVENLLAVARLRIKARRAGLTEITQQGNQVRFGPVDLPDSAQLRLKRLYPGSIVKPAVRTMLVPRPTTARVGGTPLRDREVLRWAEEVVESVLGGSVPVAAAVAAGTAR